MWEHIKSIRQPCLTGDGRPAIWFTSKPTLSPTRNYDPAERDRAPLFEHNTSVHNPQLPRVIRIEDYTKYTEIRHTDPTSEIVVDVSELKSRSPKHLTRLIISKLDFRLLENAQACGHVWINETRKIDQRARCPKCGEPGTGYGTIGNERRFYHERNRSCYLGVVENLLKRNPLVKCAKCGEMGREHKGKDGHTRVRHANRMCYIG